MQARISGSRALFALTLEFIFCGRCGAARWRKVALGCGRHVSKRNRSIALRHLCLATQPPSPPTSLLSCCGDILYCAPGTQIATTTSQLAQILAWDDPLELG